MTTKISSMAHWRQVLNSHSIVVADFYADWCGPCKMIAPTFESLAAKHAKPGRVAFAKVNVDERQDVAQQYGVRAMPTFVILRAGGIVVDEIRGANPTALMTAVDKAVKLAGPGGNSSFAGGGQRLGGSGVVGGGAGARGTAGANTAVGRSRMAWDLKKLVEMVIAFFGLYFWSLLSLDPYKAAENSPFNKKSPPSRMQSGTGTRPAARSTFKTFADLGRDE
ncbi:hypothetical protein VTK26DRAFT_1345 [Humicola hyalothermophila]